MSRPHTPPRSRPHATLTAGHRAFGGLACSPPRASSAPSTPTLSPPSPQYCQPPPGMPAAALAEPTVVGTRGGEVRRIRSVLELRLGPLACGLDKEEVLAASARGDADDEPRRARVEVDMFGIEIPRAAADAVVRAGVTVTARTPSELDLSALMC